MREASMVWEPVGLGPGYPATQDVTCSARLCVSTELSWPYARAWLGCPVVALTIEARDGATNARAGRLRTAHGDVPTPAFVPLATKATFKGLLPQEVKALGYDMVLGNTFHLMLNPGAELIELFGGLHGFMAWDGPIVTYSGGFQVFSMGHGTVADEIKARPSRQRQGEGSGR